MMQLSTVFVVLFIGLPVVSRCARANRHGWYLGGKGASPQLRRGSHAAANAPVGGTHIPAIDLGTASDFVILTKTGVTTTGVTSVTGDIGVSPAAATSITGFGLVADSNKFSTSSLVVGGGKIYAANYAPPTPAKMTTAISDMETAYTAAAGDNGTPTKTELEDGHVNGLTLPGGLYEWSTSVDFNTSLTFDAADNTDTVWIMQIAGTLSLGSGALVTLTNGAQAMNIFWQVAGSTNILAGAHAEGIILCKEAIIFGSGASLTGRALAQTAVTMIDTTVTAGGNSAFLDHTGMEASLQLGRRSPAAAKGIVAATHIPAIDLGTANEFAILTKTGVTTTGVTSVTGDIGVSPTAATSITGFGLVADSNKFSTSSLVVGKIYAANYAPPTPAKMTTAISDMETAYTAAAGDNGDPTKTELEDGHVNGLTLPGGLYEWSTSVDFSTSLTFDAADDTDTVWIMQIAGTLSLGSGALVTLTNGAQAMNIFWQVAGSTNILAGAHAEGIILCKEAIIFGSGASLTGRALAQTAVMMIATTVTAPPHQAGLTSTFAAHAAAQAALAAGGNNADVEEASA